jgi:putative SOS response-associated peptidase YedK
VCGRYVSTSSLADLAEAYEIDEIRTDALEPRYNVAPSQPVYAVVARRRPRGEVEGEGSENGPIRLLGTLRWGLVPSWAKEASVGNKMINARSEGIATKPAFREALRRRRCILPADSFYEWQVHPDGGKAPRQPYLIRRRDRRLLSLAGLWEVWRDPTRPDAPPLRTATIVTTAANAVLGPIHSRMPVALTDDAIRTWLDPTVVDPAVLTGLLVAAPDDWWATDPVSTLVNAVAHEGPELIAPLAG